MSYSTLVKAQLHATLRTLALTVEETGPGEFRWRILEGHGIPLVFESVSGADLNFAAYDNALATGYGELQRMIGHNLQYGPRKGTGHEKGVITHSAAPGLNAVASNDTLKNRSILGSGIKPGRVLA